MNEFNEDKINRDASGKFAAKTSGESDIDIHNAESNAAIDVEDALNQYGDGESLTIHPDEINDPDLLEPIQITRNGAGFTATTTHMGETSDMFYHEARKAGANEQDYADFLRSEYGASNVNMGSIDMNDESVVAEPEFSTSLGPNATTDRIVDTMRYSNGKQGFDTYIRDAQDGAALGAKFYAWHANAQQAETDARKSWEGHSRTAPFPREAFRAEYIADPTGTHSRRWTWEGSRKDDGTPIAKPGEKGAFHLNRARATNAIHADLKRTSNPRHTFKTNFSAVMDEGFTEDEHGGFTQKVDADELNEIVQKNTEFFYASGNPVKKS